MSTSPTRRLERAVETERLRLRALTTSDHDALFALQSQPAMMRYFGDGHPYDRAESRFWLEWHVAMWDLEGYGFWAVELKPDLDFLGWLGLTKVWDPPEQMPATEIGWFIDHRYWGQGLATEGAARAIRLAFDQLGLERVIARYNAENVASGRVMEKIGMRLWQQVPDPRHPGVVARLYERFADEIGRA